VYLTEIKGKNSLCVVDTSNMPIGFTGVHKKIIFRLHYKFQFHMGSVNLIVQRAEIEGKHSL